MTVHSDVSQLNALVLEYGLSPGTIHRMVGVSGTTWYKWINGHNVAARYVPRLQKVLSEVRNVANAGELAWNHQKNNLRMKELAKIFD